MFDIIVLFFAVIGMAVTALPAAAVAVKKLSKTAKLHLIRVTMTVTVTAVIIADDFGVKAAAPFGYPLRWLRHYILGSGKALQVPSHLIVAAKEAFYKTLARYYGADGDWNTPEVRSDNPFGSYHCLYHSTIYEGRGFYERPLLFYLLGGFTFLLRRDGKVSGKDRYDWHPNGHDDEGNPKYFTSPLGKGKVAAVAMSILDWVFGNDWFVCGGFPSGEHGISNKLWDDLHLVGARPFWSWFDQVEIFSETEKDMIWVMSISGMTLKESIDPEKVADYGVTAEADYYYLGYDNNGYYYVVTDTEGEIGYYDAVVDEPEDYDAE